MVPITMQVKSFLFLFFECTNTRLRKEQGGGEGGEGDRIIDISIYRKVIKVLTC